MNYCYFPIFKSRTSELRAYKELSDIDKSSILPIVELTKSRTSKNNEFGVVEKKMQELAENFMQNFFILDLTVEETLSNSQIEDMLFDNTNGYQKWVDFVMQYKSILNLIPCVHYNPEHLEDVIIQIEKLSNCFNFVALRLNAIDLDNRFYLEHIKDYLTKCIVILDAGFQKKDFDFFDYIKEISDLNIKAIICASTVFPPTIPSSLDGEVRDYDLGYQRLYAEFANVYYGDYSLTTAKRYDMQARGWIPRIDIPIVENNKSSFLYCRHRTTDTLDTEHAYIKCAQAIFDDYRFNRSITNQNSWGERVFLDAKNGYVMGKSPSFWISVRNNIYISKVILNCKKHNRRTLTLQQE